MKPPVFDYCTVSSIDEAVLQLSRCGPDARILAGGQSLIPMIKLRLARPSLLIDINRVQSLDYVRVEDECIAIGATRRLCMLESDRLACRCALLRDAVRHVGHEAIRNRGTLSGSFPHAAPGGEMPIAPCCLDGKMVAFGPAGTRTIAAREFFTSFFTPALEPDELLTEVRLPVL